MLYTRTNFGGVDLLDMKKSHGSEGISGKNTSRALILPTFEVLSLISKEMALNQTVYTSV